MSKELAPITHYSAKLSRNPVVVNIEAASPTTYPNRFGLRYYCTVMIPESYLSSVFVPLVRLEAAETPPEPAGAGKLYLGAFLEIQNQLDPLLERLAPEFNQTRISVATQASIPYYLILSIENDGEEIYSETLPMDRIVKAGVNEVDYSAYKDQFFTEYIGSERRFLTWAPNNKIIHPDQPEFLYYFTNFSPAPKTIIVCYGVTYADYTYEEKVSATMDNCMAYTLYCIPVGPKALGFDLAEKEVLSYDIWLLNENELCISEVRTYQMDQEYRRNCRFLLFANSLGGFDTICLTGQVEESLKISRSISERFAGWQFLASYAERVINSSTGIRELNVATGWLDDYGLKYLEELVLSNEVYLATDRAFLPLLPTVETLQTKIDDEDLIGRILTFTFANKETNFSALPDPAGLPARKTGWRPKAFACLLDANGKRTGFRQATILEKYYQDDNKKVVGVPMKPNVPGTEGYIPPVQFAGCAVTPYLNSEISRSGTFRKKGCASPLIGGPATVIVAAGMFGSEQSQADAQAKAEAQWIRINTQAYADQNGVCLTEPEKYAYAVPSGHWHYRVADPDLLMCSWYGFNTPYSPIGNNWLVQDQSGPYVFPMGTNDLNFPIDRPSLQWNLWVAGPANTQRRIKVYQDGVLKLNFLVSLNQDGTDFVEMTRHDADSFNLVDGGKLYITNDPA